MLKVMEFNDFYMVEARDANLKYTEKLVKGEIDKVITELEGRQSAKMTRLANGYRKLKALNEESKALELELNAESKASVSDLFDAIDVTRTCVVETCSLTLTLSKESQKTSTKIDWEGALDEMIKLTPELEEQFRAILKAKTTVTKSAPERRLSVKINEGIWDDIKDSLRTLYSNIRQWAKGYRSKLSKIEKMLTA